MRGLGDVGRRLPLAGTPGLRLTRRSRADHRGRIFEPSRSGAFMDPIKGPIELLVLQSTPFCNIDCSYCYLAGRSSRQVMSLDIVARLFEDLFTGPFIGDELSIVWHAGEPLVLGIDYYDQVLEIIRSLSAGRVRIVPCFQTNGTLITPDWIDFFRRNQVSVGLSLDGPQWLHDQHRRSRRGAGTFGKVMAAVHLLQANRYPFHVIAVLTRASLVAADEIFEFFVANQIPEVGFNIEEIEAANQRSSLSGIAYEEVRRFFYRLAMLCRQERGRLFIREFTGATDAILHAASTSYGNPQTDPLRIVTVGVDGSLSTFSPELIGARCDRYCDFRFGSVKGGGISGMLQNPYFELAEQDIAAGVALCGQNCEYFEVCLGGAPANKFFENGNLASTETMYCRYTKKAVVDVVLRILEHEISVEPGAARRLSE